MLCYPLCVCVLSLYIQVCVHIFYVSVCSLCQPVCLCVYVVCTPLIYVCLCCVCQCVCLYFCQCVCLSICCVYVCLILSANDYGVLALCQKYNIPWWKVPHYEMRTQCALCITEEERHGKRYLTNCFCQGAREMIYFLSNLQS